MPVSIRKGSGDRPYKIVEIATGKIVGSSKTSNQAKSAMRLRNAITEGGWTPTKKNPKKGRKAISRG